MQQNCHNKVSLPKKLSHKNVEWRTFKTAYQGNHGPYSKQSGGKVEVPCTDLVKR